MHRSYRQAGYGDFLSVDASVITCDWEALRGQLLMQWRLLTAQELDKAGPDRHRIARLVERKYHVASDMVENYLRNFERTMPLAAQVSIH